MSFTGQQKKQLCDAICSAFSEDALTLFVNFGLELSLGKITHQHSTLQIRVFDLIEYVENLGSSDELLRKLNEERPNNKLVKAYLEQHAPYILVPGALSRADPGPREPTGASLPKSLQDLWDRWRSKQIGGKPLRDFPLNSFCGNDEISREVISEIAPDSALLDHPTYDLESVYYLWADPRNGGRISVRFVRTPERRHVVRFFNGNTVHTSNVAFRPSGRTVLRCKHGETFQRLVFSVRIPKPSEDNFAKGEGSSKCDAEEVVLGVRVVDRCRAHWMFTLSGYYWWQVCRCPKAEAWQKVEIDLTKRSEWKLFEHDGNPLYAQDDPNFSEIMAVVIEFAKSNGAEGAPAPEMGCGTVEIANFTIDTHPLESRREAP